MSVEALQSSLDTSRRTDTIYRYIGLVALAHNSQTDTDFLKQQIITELAESIDTQMGTHGNAIELTLDAGHIIDANGGDMTISAQNWAIQQSARAKNDTKLEWFAKMALIEAKEHSDIAEFVTSSQAGDTMLVISPFPEDIYNDPATRQTVKQEGFRLDSKRAFIRVYEKTDNNGIREHIQSVDSSDMHVWNTVLQQLALPAAISREALLAQRYINSGVTATQLIEDLVSRYDDALYAKSGIVHKYGKNMYGTPEANSFVRKHSEIINDTIKELQELSNTASDAASNSRAESIIYNSKALINSLYDKQLVGQDFAVSAGDVRDLRRSEGVAAASVGKTYPGCSGESSMQSGTSDTNGGQLSHNQTFTMKSGKKVGNNLELRDIGSCPVCNTECIKGVYDAKAKRWVSCTVKGCKAYDQNLMDTINGVTKKSKEGSTDWFADACSFWGIKL